MAERILVTGGSGYIGSTLVPALLDRGFRVTVLDTFVHRQNSLAHVCHDPALEIVNADVRDAATVARLAGEADIIIPLAAIVGAPACDRDPVAAEAVNRDAVSSMLKSLSTDQFVAMPITNSGYGIGEPGAFCTEESPLRPISLYGRTKVEAEAAVLDFGNAVSLRLATVFGMSPRMRLDLLVNDFVYRAVNDRALVLFEAHFKRNYLHVRDVAGAFLHTIDHRDDMRGRPFNVGLSEANLSKRELCERIQAQLPAFTFLEAAFAEDPDKRDYIVSNARMEATGWRPNHSLDDGIAELIKGYRMLRNTQYTNL
jgi:nucleoside-diphosphate-sugar epimerase